MLEELQVVMLTFELATQHSIVLSTCIAYVLHGLLTLSVAHLAGSFRCTQQHSFGG